MSYIGTKGEKSTNLFLLIFVLSYHVGDPPFCCAHAQNEPHPKVLFTNSLQGGAAVQQTMASRSSSHRNLIHSTSSQKLRPVPVTVSGISFVSTTWLVATFLIIAGLVIAGAFPYWTSNESPTTALQAINVHTGLYYMCYTPGIGKDSSIESICSLYVYPEFVPANQTNLAKIDIEDIVFLFTGSICYGLGTGLLMISLISGIVAYCKPRIKEKSVYLVAFVIQLFASKNDHRYIACTTLYFLVFQNILYYLCTIIMLCLIL